MKPLTPRELEVASRLAAGLTRQEIGAQLGRTAESVDRIRILLLAKLGLRNNVELSRYWILNDRPLVANPSFNVAYVAICDRDRVPA